MQAITTYVTSDGKKFIDEAAASAHERSLKVVDGVKALLTKQGMAKVGKTKSGKEITRYTGLKKALALIGDWEEMKAAA
jgi:hypothetical protein